MHYSTNGKILRLCSSGFSLLSVLAALGLVSILILSVLQIGKMVNAQSRHASNIEDLENLLTQVSNVLANPVNCMGLYGGETIDISNRSTSQLDVSAKSPFAGGDAMNTLGSGHLKLTALGLILKHKLSGTTPLYQGDAVVSIDDSADPGKFKARRVSLSLQFDASNNLISCMAVGGAAAAAGMMATTISGVSAGAHVSSSGTVIPWGMCPDGQVMVGFTATKGVICSASTAAAIAGGKGCTGDNCVATDGGNCYGDNCVTATGIFCDGDNCKACGAGATCSGDNCCGGATCGC